MEAHIDVGYQLMLNEMQMRQDMPEIYVVCIDCYILAKTMFLISIYIVLIFCQSYHFEEYTCHK